MADKPVDKPSKYRPGAMWFLKWTILAFGVFFFGGLAARGLGALEGHAPDPFWHGFLRALLTFSVGGGVAVGAAMLMWWLAGPRSFSWALGVVVLGVALVLIFIWPTPFKYLTSVVRVSGEAGMGIEFSHRLYPVGPLKA